MFILKNYKGENVPLSVRVLNRRHLLTLDDNRIKHIGREENSPVQYFVYDTSELLPEEKNVFYTKKFVSSLMINFELTVWKNDTTEDEFQYSGTYENLVNEFGDKKNREKLKNKELVKKAKFVNVKFFSLNQLLPEFNLNAERIEDVYRIDLMFLSSELEQFRELALDEQNEYNLPFEVKKKEFLPILDCLYKVLICQSLNDLNQYMFFVDTLTEDSVQGNLTFIMRDKLFIKFYIVFFLANGFKTNGTKLPFFGLPKRKLVPLLKTIGCTVTKNYVITLENMPSLYN